MITYTNYTNLDARFSRRYEPGDRLVRGWQGDVEGDADYGPSELSVVAELVYAKHNADDRPDGQLCPSMSVGDVVVIGEVAQSVTSTGFIIVQLDANDILPTTYLETVR